MERRRDALVSSVASYIEALGGHLRLVADLPDGTEVEITLPSIADQAPAEAKPEVRVR